MSLLFADKTNVAANRVKSNLFIISLPPTSAKQSKTSVANAKRREQSMGKRGRKKRGVNVVTTRVHTLYEPLTSHSGCLQTASRLSIGCAATVLFIGATRAVPGL